MITITKEIREDIGRRGEALYAQDIRARVETPENIGKMLIIDVDTGEYIVEEKGVIASLIIRAKRPDALLYGLRIGYNVTATIGGVMEANHMITGRIENRKALLPVTYRLPGQPDFVLEHVVDTGFNGQLTLPASAVAAMGLPFDATQRINLADDSAGLVNVHLATIVWEGQAFVVRVFATGMKPLLGTALMDAKELVIQFADRGLVTLDDF